MANQGLWTPGMKATSSRFNGGLVQLDTETNRPAAGEEGRKFVASDTKKVFRDDGSAWETVLDVDAPASSPSLRTLGAGSQQAAAGNHTH